MSICGVCKKDKDDMQSPSVCVECAEHRKEYYKNHSTKLKENSEQWRSQNELKVKQYRKDWIAKNKDKVRDINNKYKSSFKGRYRRAIERAVIRGVEFSITYEQFVSALSQDCIYCHGAFGRVKWGVGLDRMDNSKGYIDGNVVSCCKRCNILKSDWLSFEETKAAVEAILKVRAS